MKLLQRYFRYQLAFTVPIMVLGTISGFVLVNTIVKDEVDEQLQLQAEQVAHELSIGQAPSPSNAPDVLVAVAPGTMSAALFKDTSMYNAAEEEVLPWRLGRVPVQIPNGDRHIVTVGRSLVNTDEMIATLALALAALLALMAAGNFILSRRLSVRLWRPFQHALDEIDRFRVDGSRSPDLPDPDVDEFARLNRTLRRMMAQMREDHSAQKRFTEHAAHELQTPLAIMQGKLDQLIQSPRLGPADAELLTSLLQARERMGRSVGNMLLLARIGNQQFPASHIDWLGVIQEQEKSLADLIEERGLTVDVRQEQECRSALHPFLAELLVGNLFRNAVLHNIRGGYIRITINVDGFSITNSGQPLRVPPEALFERFAKGDPASSSTGLGLSLAQEIATHNGMRIVYESTGAEHRISIRQN